MKKYELESFDTMEAKEQLRALKELAKLLL